MGLAARQRASGDEVSALARLRPRLVWGLPATFTLSWLVFVLWQGHLARVLDNWQAAVTMIFGSFVSGSTPQGGGSVAFPVFTKVLEIPAEVARSFSLLIQASGMVMASATILLAGRRIDRKAVGVGVAGGAIGLLFGLYVLGRPDAAFWPARIDPAYTKVTFTVFIFAVAMIVSKCAARSTRYDQVPSWSTRSTGVLLMFAAIGGVLTSLTGSGVNVLIFMFVVLVADVSPKVAIPTSIISMATISVFGALVVVVGGGHLDTVVRDVDGTVELTAVGGQPFGPADFQHFDIFGLWLAAAPIVVWGAPLGSYVAHRVSERTVIRFVAAMAILEVATTVLLLDRLRSDWPLAAYGLIGVMLAAIAIQRLERLAPWIMGDVQDRRGCAD